MIYPELVSASLLGAEWRCGSSPLFFPTHTCTVEFCLFFFKLYLNTLDIFSLSSCMCLIWTFTLGRHSIIEGSLNFAVQIFPEEVLKLLANFLIVILTFSEMGIRLCRRTCWMYPHKLASSVASNILRGLRSCHRRLIIWPLIWRRYFWEILLVPQFPVMIGDPKKSEELLCSVLGNMLPAFSVS